MHYIKERRCTSCNKKISCDVFQDKQELTVSGWDKNRFATSCREYREKGK